MKLILKRKEVVKKLLLIIIILGLSGALVYLAIRNKPVTQVEHHRSIFSFRDNVKEAEKIKVIPDEKQLNDAFWDYRIKNITYYYMPLSPKTNGYYQVEVFEITSKITQMFNTRKPIIIQKNFNAEQISSFNNITREDEVLKIIFVPPEIANETYVRVGGNRVWIYASSYRDFDLAVIKTILTAMWKYTLVEKPLLKL